MKPLRDEELWERWRAGRDADAFAEIVSRHAALVHGAARRVLRNEADAEDVAQQCFLELIRTQAPVRTSLASWLHSLATRRSLDRIKADARRRRREAAGVDRPERGVRAAEEAIDMEEILERIDQAIEELPEELKAPILLRFVDGLTTEEVGRELGLRPSTTSYRITKGVERVRSILHRAGVRVSLGVLLSCLGTELARPAPAALSSALRRLALDAPPISRPALPRTAHGPSSVGAWKGPLVAGGLALALLAGGIAWTVISSREPRPAGVLPPPAKQPLAAADAERVDVGAGAREPILPPVPGIEGAIPAPEPAAVLCRDEDGQPVPGAEVYIFEACPDPDPGSQCRWAGPVPSNEQGIARFPGFAPGAELTAWALLPGRLSGIGFARDSPPGAPHVEVLLQPSARLEGVVRVPPGTPPGAVRVRIEALQIQDPLRPWNQTLQLSGLEALESWPSALERRPGDQSGFAFEDLPAAAEVRLVAGGIGLGEIERRVSLPWPLEPIFLSLEPEAVLEGLIGDVEEGVPAAGAPLILELEGGDWAGRILTDEAGRFRRAGLPGGSYSLYLPPAFDRSEKTLRPLQGIRLEPGGRETIQHQFERGAIVSGTVRDAASGLGLRTMVAAVPRGGHIVLGGAPTGEDGRYAFRLPRGETLLYIAEHLPGYVTSGEAGRREVVIEPGEASKEGLDFDLAPREAPGGPVRFGRLHGTVLRPDGRPAAGILVKAFTLHDPEDPLLSLHNKRTVTDDAGRYEVLVVAERSVHLAAEGAEEGKAAAGPFQLRPDEVLEAPPLVLSRPAAAEEKEAPASRAEH